MPNQMRTRAHCLLPLVTPTRNGLSHLRNQLPTTQRGQAHGRGALIYVQEVRYLARAGGAIDGTSAHPSNATGLCRPA